jgi:hypothetical protein
VHRNRLAGCAAQIGGLLAMVFVCGVVMVIAKCPQAVRDGWAVPLTDCTVKPSPVTDSHTARSQTVTTAAVVPADTARMCLHWEHDHCGQRQQRQRSPQRTHLVLPGEPPCGTVWTDSWWCGRTLAGAAGGTLEER